jgi:hypothetical protein
MSSGEFPLGLVYAHRIEEMKAKGMNTVEWLPLEPIVATPIVIGIGKMRPIPTPRSYSCLENLKPRRWFRHALVSYFQQKIILRKPLYGRSKICLDLPGRMRSVSGMSFRKVVRTNLEGTKTAKKNMLRTSRFGFLASGVA